MGPLARLQYTLEQYRDGTASVSLGRPDKTLPTQSLAIPLSDVSDSKDIVTESATVGIVTESATVVADAAGVAVAEGDVRKVKGGKKGKRRTSSVKNAGVGGGGQSLAAGGEEEVRAVGEDQSRLLPPVVVPQVGFK